MVICFLFVPTNCMNVYVEPPFEGGPQNESEKISSSPKMRNANKLTYFDQRFYTPPLMTQKIIEYFYPKNSSELNDSSYPISQIFKIEYSENHIFTLILWKDGSLTYKSSVQFEPIFFGFENFSKEVFKNWKKDIFSMSVLSFGNILILNKKLGLQIMINCFLGEKPIVLFSAIFLNPIEYFRAPSYLGFSQIHLIDGKLHAYKYNFENKYLIKIEEKVSKKEFLTDPGNDSLTEAILKDLFDDDKYINIFVKKKKTSHRFSLSRLCSKSKCSSCKKVHVKKD